MRDYELTVLYKGNLEEKELDHEIKNLQTTLEKGGVKIVSKKDAAKKSMAYEIKHAKEAYYIYMELSMEPTAVLGIEEKLRLTDTIIRHLLVVK